MRVLPELFANNREWARQRVRDDPDFFRRLTDQQTPRYLWIGCADSRVPANEIVGLDPGELFVQRNVANLVIPGDLNCMSVLQYAVDVLQVEHVIVCGHYGCGGIVAALRDVPLGLIDGWLQHVQRVASLHADRLVHLERDAALDRLCELNVIEQARSVCATQLVEAAWARGQKVTVHGWIYALQDGLLRDLGFCVRESGELAEAYAAAVATRPLPPTPLP